VDGNPYFTGSPLVLSSLGLGQHQIYIVVTDISTGCTSTSGKYDLFIKHCGDCDCKESHWGDISLTEGEMNNAKGDPIHGVDVKPGIKAQGDPIHGVDVKPGVKAQGDPIHGVDIKPGLKNNNRVVADSIKLECKKPYSLKCNQPYTINASYICKDTLCPPKVTYSLQPPGGSAITGPVAFSFTPVQNGVYILTLYGWCGDKICDSCVIDLTVKCDSICDCKGSKWGEKTYMINNVSKPITCMKPADKPITIKCKDAVSINANYTCADPHCPGTVSYSLTTPSGNSSGNVPLTFIANQTGLYTVTLYGMCGNTVCDSCVIRFRTDCPVDSNCCPYNITVTPKQVTYTASTKLYGQHSFGCKHHRSKGKCCQLHH
jgi:hypothetical protein